jgi:protein-disulfide isomerase
VKIIGILTASALAVATLSSQSMAAQETSMPLAQQKQMEQVIHDYLVNNPEVLVEASQVLQKRQQDTAQSQAQSSIMEHADELFTGKLTVAGNPKGDVTLVEFFDYQCIHCKKMKPVLSDLLAKNKNLRVIYKEFPIFGKSSELASKATIAAAMQGKYAPMQEALLSKEKPLDEKTVMEVAQSIGLKMDQLKKDMDSKGVQDELAANRKLAEQIHLMGTPAFIVASTPMGKFDAKSTPSFIPGGATEASLQAMIDKAAKK